MLKISIEKANLTDLPQLQKIASETFFESFSAENTDEDMQTYLARNFSTEKLILELNDQNSDIYFAVFEQKVIGYLKLNFRESQSHLQDDDAIQIERLYISKEYQNKNVGQFLLEKAIEIAKNADKAYVWLGVWTENIRAIKFYKRNNFSEFGNYIFMLGKDEQQDILMKLLLI